MIGPPPRPQATEATDDLVEDEIGAHTVAPLTQRGQVARRRRVDAPGPDDRFGDHRGDPALGCFDQLVERRAVVIGNLDHVGDQGPETLSVARQAGERHRCHR